MDTSISKASSALLKGAISLDESVLSLSLISLSITSTSRVLSLICLSLLSALILGSAIKKNLKFAFGNTTVPISLPSTTSDLELAEFLNKLSTKFLISGFLA